MSDYPDRRLYVTLDCGCITEIDCHDNWEESDEGLIYKTSDTLSGGRITKLCDMHSTATAREN